MNVKCLATILAVSVHPIVSFAASESGAFSVVSLRIGPSGVSVRLDPAPSGCAGGENFRMHALVSATDPNFNALLSGLLTAYTTGERLAWIWYADGGSCNDSEALALTQIEFAEN